MMARGIAERSHPQRMFLQFSDGARIGLALNGLSREDLKEFILSVQAYARAGKI
jgi:hypothetical protein